MPFFGLVFGTSVSLGDDGDGDFPLPSCLWNVESPTGRAGKGLKSFPADKFPTPEIFQSWGHAALTRGVSGRGTTPTRRKRQGGRVSVSSRNASHSVGFSGINCKDISGVLLPRGLPWQLLQLLTQTREGSHSHGAICPFHGGSFGNSAPTSTGQIFFLSL